MEADLGGRRAAAAAQGSRAEGEPGPGEPGQSSPHCPSSRKQPPILPETLSPELEVQAFEAAKEHVVGQRAYPGRCSHSCFRCL